MGFLDFEFDIDRYINSFVPRSRLYLLPRPIAHFLGHRETAQKPIGSFLQWWWAFVGAFAGLLVVEGVFMTDLLKRDGAPIIIGSLGASAILEYNTIDSPLSQPRNVLFGQFFASVIGVGIAKLFHLNPNFENLRFVGGALAVGITSAFMSLTKTVHPPAGATALLAVTSNEITDIGWYLVALIVLGSSLMLAVACLLNNIQRQFPKYWWTPVDLSKQARVKNDDAEKGITEGKVVEEVSKSGERNSGEDEKSLITIDGTGVSVPDWILLEADEKLMLQSLRQKLREGERLRSIQSRESDVTHVHDDGARD